MGFLDLVLGGSAFTSGDHIVTLGIPKYYGYVIFVAIASAFMIIWMSAQVKLTSVVYYFLVFFYNVYKFDSRSERQGGSLRFLTQRCIPTTMITSIATNGISGIAETKLYSTC